MGNAEPSGKAPSYNGRVPLFGGWDPRRIYDIPVDRIASNPRQPRRRIEPTALADLVRSIQENGVLVPILVRPLSGRRFELVAGQRRLLACRKLGRPSVPALVRDLSEEQIVRLGFLENAHRAGLSAVEEAGALRALGTDFEVLPSEEVARRVGFSPEGVERRLRLLRLPVVVQEAVIVGLITAEHAEALLGLEDPERQVALLRQIHREALSPRQTRERVAALLSECPSAPPPAAPVSPAAASCPIADSSADGLDAVARDVRGLVEAFAAGERSLGNDLDRIVRNVLDRLRRDPASVLAWNPSGAAAPPYPVPHLVRAASHALYLARQAGIPEYDATLVGAAALLADAGLWTLSPEIVSKKGRLTPFEQASLARHVTEARERLLDAGVHPRVARIVEQHHERFDGSGYPSGARGTAVDPFALWVGLADMYTALAEPRSWRGPFSPRQAVQQVLLSGHRGAFPKHLLRDFLHAFGFFPVGSRVRLRSGRAATVVRANPDAIHKPAVRLDDGTILDLAQGADEIPPEQPAA